MTTVPAPASFTRLTWAARAVAAVVRFWISVGVKLFPLGRRRDVCEVEKDHGEAARGYPSRSSGRHAQTTHNSHDENRDQHPRERKLAARVCHPPDATPSMCHRRDFLRTGAISGSPETGFV